MQTIESVVRFLNDQHAPFTPVAHRPAFTAQEEAAAAHVPGRGWAKTVVCFADDEPVLAVLPAPLRLSFEKLQALTGAKTVRLASEKELAELYPDCEVGAMPPLGPLFNQRVFVDLRLTSEPDIVFDAGTHTDAIRMPYAAFRSVVRPTVGELAM